MPGVSITNPAGVFGQAAYHSTDIQELVSAGTIAAGDWVSFTAPGTVEAMDVSDATAVSLSAGVATEAAVAGDIVRVVRSGPVICNINDTTVAAIGDYAVKHATADGASGTVAIAAADATTVVGTILGTYLSTEIGTSGTAWVDVHKQ
jgi:hypothetical protein